MAPQNHIEVRMAVIESRVTELIEEGKRTRDRLHDIETDRATIRLLAQKVDGMDASVRDVSVRLDELSKNMEKVAEQAADRVIYRWEHDRDDSSLKVWANRAAFIVALIACAGLIIQAWVAIGQ